MGYPFLYFFWALQILRQFLRSTFWLRALVLASLGTGMKPVQCILWFGLWMVGLHKAIAVGGSSSSKRKAGDSDSEDWASFSIRLHTSNVVPATTAKLAIEKAQKAGAAGIKLKVAKGKANAARALRNAAPKTSWPPIYWAKIPMKNRKTNQVVSMWHAFQLPHEWLGKYMADQRAIEAAQPAQGSKTWQALTKIGLLLSAQHPNEFWASGTYIALGFHGDGVPVQGTIREESLDFLTINLPAMEGGAGLRVPFTVFQSKFHWEYKTKAAILEVLLWSFDCLKQGRYPTRRHDGSPWLKSDKTRAKLKGKLPVQGILCEIRGDWDWLNSWLNFPVWNTGSGMRWLCKAKHVDFKNFSQNDRETGLCKDSFVQRVVDMGKELCPFWGWPELRPADLCLPDWMHAVDQGIGADIAGQLLVELAKRYPGRALKEKVASLWQDIQLLYSEHHVEYKLHTLTPEVLNKGKSKKKTSQVATLKGPAAAVRHLVPLLPILTAKHFAEGTELQKAYHKLARFLAEAYLCVETNSLQDLPKWGAKVAGQYMALEAAALRLDPESKDWHIMPKLHLFQHLCESTFPPKSFWCYKDETTGGLLKQLFTRRGGKDTPGVNAANCLLKWQQSTAFPAMRQH